MPSSICPPPPTSSSSQFLPSLYLLSEALLPSPPSPRLQHISVEFTGTPAPAGSLGTLRDSTGYISLPRLFHFRNLSGVDPLTSLFCLQLSDPKVRRHGREPQQDFSYIILEVPHTLKTVDVPPISSAQTLLRECMKVPSSLDPSCVIKAFLHHHVPLGDGGLWGRWSARASSYNTVLADLPKEDDGLWEQRLCLNHLGTSRVNPALSSRANAQHPFAKELHFQTQHSVSSLHLHALLSPARVFCGQIRWQRVTEAINTKEMSLALLQAENRRDSELNCSTYLTALRLLSRLENGGNSIICLKGLWEWDGKTHGGAQNGAGP